MKTLLKIVGGLLLVILLLLFIYINVTLPSLPPGAKKKINQIVKTELADLEGYTGFVNNGETKIWYEVIQPEGSIKGTILLIMGISNDALAWPKYFIDPLVSQGYQVIRFDNRGVGLTDWFEDWTKETSYTLEDMAGDAISILDTLKIDKAHILGVSLGGMIAQTFCISYPERSASLISMMSSGHIMDKELPPFNTSVIKDLMLAHIKYGLINTEKNEIKMQILARQLLQGEKEYDINIEEVAYAVLYNLRKRKGYNQDAFKQQSAATIKSGSRYEALKKLEIPSLIIHGTSDPMIHFEHGKKCFELIPNADKLWLEGMGHDIPEGITAKVILKIVSHIQKADTAGYM